MTRKNRPDIESLLADRARYETWLAQLNAKAPSVPAHVVERVRADYQERAARVVEELRTRADELRAETAALEQRITTLTVDLTAKRDARAEDELRSLVGEYEGDAWQKKAAEHDRMIAALDSERATREAELTRVKELLSDATRPSRAMRRISAADIPEEPTPVAAGSRAPSVAPPAAPPPPPAPPPPGDKRPSPFDELGFLRTVVGRATPLAIPVQTDGVDTAAHAPSAVPPPPTPPPVHPSAAAPPPAQHAPPAPAAAAAPTPVAAPAPPPPPAPSAWTSAVAAAPPGQPVAQAAPAAAPPPAPRRSIPNFEPPPIPDAPVAVPAQAAAPAAAPVATANDLVTFGEAASDERSPRNSQAARTLKCQECGWMNYPTEWYCEKCGGELAAF